MSKRDDYPQNRHITARMRAIIQGFSMCRSTLANVNEFMIPKLEGQVQAILAKQIKEALEAAELALQAMSGED